MTMRFRALAETLEALEPVTSRLQMIAILADLLRQPDPEEVGELVYLVQGRLLPDFVQEEFGMNERLIVRSISQAYDVPQDAVLDRWKQLGDIGLTAQEFAPQQATGADSEGGLPLKEVYARLMAITKTVGQGSQEGIDNRRRHDRRVGNTARLHDLKAVDLPGLLERRRGGGHLRQTGLGGINLVDEFSAPYR